MRYIPLKNIKENRSYVYVYLEGGKPVSFTECIVTGVGGSLVYVKHIQQGERCISKEIYMDKVCGWALRYIV